MKAFLMSYKIRTTQLIVLGYFYISHIPPVISQSQKEIGKASQIEKTNKYILNPDQSDTTCLKDILRAKTDIKNGHYAYVQENFGFNRYQSELKILCSQFGLDYKNELIDCVYIEGQTQGCYIAYMNKALADKYGQHYKESIDKKADTLFLEKVIENEIPVADYFCDIIPIPILESEKTLETTLEVNYLDLMKNPNGGTWPSLDIHFLINLDSSISTISRGNFLPNLSHNNQFEDKLFQIAIDEINNKYNRWIPGKILGKPVLTTKHLRITFLKD